MSTITRGAVGGALGAAALIVALGGCAQEVAPPVAFAVFDLPAVAHPPTPDPPTDPRVGPPQVLLSPAYLSTAEVTAVGGGRVDIVLAGSVPTPCHVVRGGAIRGGDGPTIDISLWSEAPSATPCSQMLTSFAHSLSVAGLNAGTYVVRIDGIEISEVELSGTLSA